MDDDPDGRLGLATITLTDKSIFDPAFQSLAQPISDYSFANVFAWTTALKLYWVSYHRHLCIFANGTGDLTMLLPPMPQRGATPADLRRCLGDAFDLMDAYNDVHAERHESRIEYVSDEMLERINAVLDRRLRLSAAPMSGDYIYPVGNMIDLPGGSLKSKRHARTKFMRDYPGHRAEPMQPHHVERCLGLLEQWRRHGDEVHAGQTTEDGHAVATAELRRRDTYACSVALTHHAALGMKGMVLYVDDQLIGFTLGESLSPAQASILFEKTDPAYHGAPQYIFSEFCRQWADKPEINVGDDWGIPTLRFTKQSYRPTRHLSKYVIHRPLKATRFIHRNDMPLFEARPVPIPHESKPHRSPLTGSAGLDRPADQLIVRPATADDIPGLLLIEHSCFQPEEAFTIRQIRGLIGNPNVLSRVADGLGPEGTDLTIAGWIVALVRQHRGHRSGRIYTIAIDPTCQGKGVGKLLLTRTINELKEKGVRHVYLEVRADNEKAIALYEKMGFECVRFLHDYYEEGRHGISMKLTIGVESTVRV
jgi:ribosomal protein S18 acetylase RimI-like enzyme